MQNELGQCLGTTLDRLQTIWDEIGIHHDQRRERTKVVFLHLHTLLEEMVKEEESLKNNLLANVEKYGAELIKLSKEMSVPVHEVNSMHNHVIHNNQCYIYMYKKKKIVICPPLLVKCTYLKVSFIASLTHTTYWGGGGQSPHEWQLLVYICMHVLLDGEKVLLQVQRCVYV